MQDHSNPLLTHHSNHLLTHHSNQLLSHSLKIPAKIESPRRSLRSLWGLIKLEKEENILLPILHRVLELHAG